MRVALESAALAVWQELACRIETTSPKLQISNLQISDPPSNLPPAPPRIPPGRPKLTTNLDFVIFKKTLAVAERAAKKLCWMDLDTNMHQKCNL